MLYLPAGHYLLLELPNSGQFGAESSVVSPVFDPPPCYHRNSASEYYNSCTVRHVTFLFQFVT